MTEIKTSVIVTGHRDLFTSVYDRPLNVAGKTVRLKSITYPGMEFNRRVKYKFRVQYSEGVVDVTSDVIR